MQNNTLHQYQQIFTKCRTVFTQKTIDYGTAWRILRASSIADQIYIKAKRIRTLEEKGIQQIDENEQGEFIGIVNYSIMAIIQLSLPPINNESELELGLEQALKYYDEQAEINQQLMQKKNHDYGEAWRSMRVSSFTDLILMKLLRIKQIENNDGKTLVSEGIEANYRDMINYALFALIKLSNN